MKQALPLFMAIKELRNAENLTQEGLAKKAGISIQYVRMIEQGYCAISDEYKEKIAQALNISVWALFPGIKREIDLMKILRVRHGKELIIKSEEIAMFNEVLSRISPDQFDELIASGISPKDVHRLIRVWAKKLNIEAIK
jgi:transcriptional regulator with XRE-family HTH domain